MSAQPATAIPDQDLVPVGTSSGYLLLQLLSLNGWQTTIQAATGGVRVTAQLGDHTVSRTGPTVADIACDLFKAAMATTHNRQGDPARVSAPRGCA